MSVCVYDFAGNGVEVADRWADYDPTQHLVVFGGCWSDVPDWVVDHEPTESEVLQHVVNHQQRRTGWIDPAGLGEYLWRLHYTAEVHTYSVTVRKFRPTHTAGSIEYVIDDNEIGRLLAGYLATLPPTDLKLMPVRNTDGSIEII